MRPWIDAVYIAAFLALDWAAAIHVSAPAGITPWNPSTGLALAWLVLRGPWRAVPLYAVNVFSDFALQTTIGGPFAVFTTDLLAVLAYTGAALLLTRQFRIDPLFQRLNDLVLLLAVAAVVAAGLAVCSVAVYVLAGDLPVEAYMPGALRQWVGDVIGIAVVTPIVFRAQSWGQWTWRQPNLSLVSEAALATLLIAGVLWIVFGVESTDEYKVFYLLFLPVVAVAVRHGIDGACLALLFTQIGMIALIQFRGLGSGALVDFQVQLLSLTITGLLTGVVVTERQRAERASREADRRLRERQNELEHASRLSALGEMASTLAHELNQPMTASRAYIKVAQRLLAEESGAKEPPGETVNANRVLDSITNAVTQIDLAGAIVRNLRDLIRRRSAAPERIDLGDVVEQSLALMRVQLRQSAIQIEVNRSAGLPLVTGERIRLQQVLINLLRNAIEAVEAVPRARRRIVIALSAAQENTQVQVSIRDQGPGIAQEIKANLFNAFTTSKPDGLGLGLSICRGIVEAHGGRLWLASTGSDGSDFRFTLPATDANMPA